MTTYWRHDYDRLERSQSVLSGDDRKQIRAGKIRANLCTRAMRAAITGRPFDVGDPKTGRPWPPGEDIWQAYQHGLDEAAWIARWQAEQRQARAMKDMQRQAQAVLRPVVKQRSARHQARVRRAVRLAGLWSPKMARRTRRFLRA